MLPSDTSPVNHYDLVDITQRHSNAWGEIYNQYASVLYGICFRMVGNEKTAQILFVKAFAEIHQKVIDGVALSIPLCLIKHTYQVVIKHVNPVDVKLFAKKILQ